MIVYGLKITFKDLKVVSVKELERDVRKRGRKKNWVDSIKTFLLA